MANPRLNDREKKVIKTVRKVHSGGAAATVDRVWRAHPDSMKKCQMARLLTGLVKTGYLAQQGQTFVFPKAELTVD